MGIPDRFIEHGSVKDLLQEIGLTTDEIAAKAKKIIPETRRKRAY